MQIENTKSAYGWAAITLHWIAAIGVIAMFWLGIQAYLAEQAHDMAARRAAMGMHVSLGMTLFVFLAARVVWHYAQPRPAKPPQAGWLNAIASITQNLLLIAIAVQIVSGPLAVWSGGRPINVFGLVSLPSPFPARNQGVHEIAEIAHAIGRLVILVVVPLHVLGALKHVVIDRDNTLQRMLWVRKDA